MLFYSGINSSSFSKGYDEKTKTFSKLLIPKMNHPGSLFLHRVDYSIDFNSQKYLLNHCCGSVAKKNTLLHGGFPLVFSVELDEEKLLLENVLSYEKMSGKLNRNHLLLNSNSLIKVEKIYVVTGHIKNLVTRIKEI
jgi:hypothetical protein